MPPLLAIGTTAAKCELIAWWRDGVQYTRWYCTICGKRHHTTTEAENCFDNHRKENDDLWKTGTKTTSR